MSEHASAADDVSRRIGRAVAGGGFLLGVLGIFAAVSGAFELVGIPMETVLIVAVGFALVAGGWTVLGRVVDSLS